MSIFAQTEYDLTSNLRLTTGFRWIDEEKEIDYTHQLEMWNENRDFLRPVNPVAFLTIFNEGSAGSLAKYDKDLWSAKVGLDWQVNDDLLTYFTFNRGVKGGGFNGSALGQLLRPEQYPVKEEILKAYEIGFKSTLWDDRLRVNAAAFYYDYEDFQAFIFEGTATIVVNKDAEIWGAELEFQGSPMEGLEFQGGVGYLPRAKAFDLTFAGLPQTLDRRMPKNAGVVCQRPVAL